MKLKNNALQELYDTIVNGTFVLSMYAALPIDKAFRECDEKLSESVTFEKIRSLQIDNDILKGSNKVLYSANAEMAGKMQKLEKEVEDLKKAKLCLEQSRQGWVNMANKSVEEFNLANKEITELKNRLDKANADRTERENEAIRDLDNAKKQLKYFTQSRDDWRSRAKHAEDEVESLKKDNKDLEKRLMETTETLEKTNADRNSYNGLYTELKKDYDKLFEENRKLKARTDCLRYEVELYRKHYKELKKQLEELASQCQKLTIENKRLQNNVRSGYDQGQTDLWVALQNVNNSQPLELATCFPDVTGMEDILNWDLEDFLDAYKKWQEEKEKERFDHMRDYLARFCEGRVCKACPLGSNEYKCGCGYSFKKRDEFDLRIIPDEELERYYEKARGCGAYNLKDGNINISTRAWHGDAIAEKIKIEPWSCTLEGTINVEFDRDLLEKVCGVKPDDE